MTVCQNCGAEVRCRCGKPSVAEAIAYMETHPGARQRDAAELAGVTQAAISQAVTKHKSLSNVTAGPEAADYDETVPYAEQLEVQRFVKSLLRLDYGQKRYVWQYVLPKYDPR